MIKSDNENETNKASNIGKSVIVYNDLCAIYNLYLQILKMYFYIKSDFTNYCMINSENKLKNVLKVNIVKYYSYKLYTDTKKCLSITDTIEENLKLGKMVNKDEICKRENMILLSLDNIGKFIDQFYNIKNKYKNIFSSKTISSMRQIHCTYIKLYKGLNKEDI